ncbi:MAG: hypothetical protein KF908_01080 [Nitrosomonas sp.]|nr:hypothetical protein [Nitrosomonas sp.]MCW5606498.1 hypothetical protein [Nitrosomonas sp.]
MDDELSIFAWIQMVDTSLEGDVAVRRGLQKLLNISAKLTVQETRQWLAPFSPRRALIAVHL